MYIDAADSKTHNSQSHNSGMRVYNTESQVERIALAKSNSALRYGPREKIGIVELPDFPSLGQLAALRFLEWLQLNPEGVVALPTGKTPEHFIKWTERYLNNWNDTEIQESLSSWGLDTGNRPEMKSFKFVQIDEFFPMDPEHENSFAYYIKHFYFDKFGMDSSRALLMDAWSIGAPEGRSLGWVFPSDNVELSLRYGAPTSRLEQYQANAIAAADQFAMEYESKITELGGIGFFLGGIGPDGHIGFNVRGSDHFSTTRLTHVNYETAAAAAVDLGGIEVARKKVVMTIGLRTITQNPTVTALIIAAGESKGKVVKGAVEKSPSVMYPGTALQSVKGSRFYLTSSVAKKLTERNYQKLMAEEELSESAEEHILIDIAAAKSKRLIDLKPDDIAESKLGKFLPLAAPALNEVAERVTQKLQDRIELGRKDIEGKCFLHTAPHHDDIMLGYMPYLTHLVRSAENTHYCATFTSGFTSVTDEYLFSQLENLEQCISRDTLETLKDVAYFAPDNTAGRTRDIYQYLDGVAANSPEMQREAEARRLLRSLVAIFDSNDINTLRKKAKTLSETLSEKYPGKRDSKTMQALKGMVREWEEELLWGHLGFSGQQVYHLRLGFYTGDIFTPQLEWERDVLPVLELLRETNPDIITVALDPEGSGPDTHYKTLQAVSEALQVYLKENPEKQVEVWGYRNVWFRFHPSEANIYVPVSMNSFATLHASFKTCFGSQRSASFPSYEYDGPFSDLAQKIMVEQYRTIKTCLGRDYFYSNPVPRLTATRGLCFLRSMKPDEFFEQARSLKKSAEK